MEDEIDISGAPKDCPFRYYIPHRLAIVHYHYPEQWSKACALAFDWANRMGLEGKRVWNLFIKHPEEPMGPLSLQTEIWCQISCTKEEMEAWDKRRKDEIRKQLGVE